MIPVQEADHSGTGLALLIDQFRGQHSVRGILNSFLSQVQEVEDATFAVISGRILDAAVDAQLDSLGDLVGEPRKGRSDTDYREAIRLRIRVNRSNGRAEDVIDVVRIATSGALIYNEYYPAGFEVDAFGLASPRELQKLIGQTRAVAVRGVLVSSTTPANQNFVYGSVYGAAVGQKGFGSSYDAAVGGRLVSAQDT